ncbi:MAG: hypothetical protein H0X37_12820 [Herpetosiphonaceae bacterium]|nr:hypothetical protein [Herpetosiphonaceae bacterium]
MKRLLLVLVVLATLLPGLVGAQVAPVTLSVRVGLGGLVKQNSWAPAIITVTNSGQDLQGEIEWRWDNEPTVFAQTLDLPRGANKQLLLPVRAPSFGGRGTVRFLVGGQPVALATAVADVADMGQAVLAVLGDEGPAIIGILMARNLPSLRALQLTSGELPDRPELLAAMNWLILTGDTAQLQAEQQAALQGWVATGGHLVINGARPQTALGLGALAPATVDDTDQTLPAADVVPPSEVAQPGPVHVLHLVPRAGTTAQTTATGVTTFVQHRYGMGMVIQSAVDLAHLGTTRAGLARLIGLDTLDLSSNNRSPAFGLLERALRLPALRLPSFGALLSFLLCYVILVGPVNYLLLRRWDRREWAYVTIPLTVAVFTIGAYLWGTTGRGSRVIVNELAVVHAASGATTGQATTEVGVYSPVRRAYTLGFPADALVEQSMSSFRRTAGTPIRTLRTDSAVEVPNVLVDVGALQSFTAEQTISVPPIRVTQTGGATDTVLVHNDSNQALEDVIIVQDGNALQVGALQPGAEQRITLPVNGALGGLNVPGQGTINRQAVLMTMVEGSGLFDNNPAAPPHPDASAPAPAVVAPQKGAASQLLVFAWLPTSQLPLQIDHRTTSTQGETLLIVGADDAPDH